MTYHRETGQVEYRCKDGKETKVFDALEWLAAMCSHVPNKGEQAEAYFQEKLIPVVRVTYAQK